MRVIPVNWLNRSDLNNGPVTAVTRVCSSFVVERISGGYSAKNRAEFLSGIKFYPSIAALRNDLCGR